MKESNTLVGNVTIKHPPSKIFTDTKGQYMKESNTLVDNVTINHPPREILPDTKGEYMKESGIKFRSKIDV